MQDLNYEAPTSIDSAVTALAAADENARIFAGGTDLLVQLREDLIKPSLFIDIKKITEARTISIDQDHIRIGAAITGAELDEHRELKSLIPGVAEAVGLIGSAQVQGRATIGGNLCNASPAADSVPALISVSALAEVAGPNGLREISVEKILSEPGKTTLERGEFVVTLKIPRPDQRSADAYLRFIPRTEMDIAVVGAGASIALDRDGFCSSARLALGAVAPTARQVERVSHMLLGHKLDEAILQEISKAARDICDPIDDKRGTVEFRTHVAGVLAKRVVKIAWRRAEAR